MEFNLKRDINKTIEMMEMASEGKKITDIMYYPPFASAVIPHSLLFPKMEGTFNSFLGLTGSFTPALNAIHLGAKDVTCFDISVPVGYYAYYQIASILALDYEEYINFLFNFKDRKSFNFDTYQKIRDYLPTDYPMNAKKYFDVLYDYLGEEEIRTNFFIHEKFRFSTPYDLTLKIEQAKNLYLDKKSFYELKEKIKQVRMQYLLCDIRDVPQLLAGKSFDKIYLSCAHIFMYKEKSEENLLQYFCLMDEYKKLLNDNGVLQAGYFYNHLIKRNDISTMLEMAMFENIGYQGVDIDDEVFIDTTDRAYLYQKVR